MALVLSLGWGCDDDPTQEQTEPARIISFSMLPKELDEPGQVQISWQTANADALFLIQNGEMIPLEDAPLRVGSVEVFVERTSTFELIATGKVGAEAKEIRTVTVAEHVNPPVIGSFTGPELVGANAEGIGLVHLEWSGVEGATALRLEADTQASRHLDPSEASGSIELLITEDTTFELVATNAGGEARQSVTVGLVPLPTIEVLSIDRSWVGAGDAVEVQWATAGAAGVELWVNGVALEEIDPEQTAGEMTLHPLEDAEIELRAYAEVGTWVSDRTTVTVAPPQILTLTGSSTSLWLGESLSLSWTSQGGSSVEVRVEGVDDPVCASDDLDYVAGASCEWQPPATGDYLFTLSISNGSGTASSDWALSVGTGPRILAFTMSPDVLNFGDEVLINWTVLDDPDGAVPTLTLRDDRTNTYPLPTGQRFARIPLDQATGDLEFTLHAETDHPLSTADEAQARVMVHGLPTATLSVTPEHFDGSDGEEAVISWTSSFAEELVLYEVMGDDLEELLVIPEAERAAGSHRFVPIRNATYRLIATNPLGRVVSVDASITITPPEILSFTVEPAEVVAGQPVILSWTTRMAEEVSLSIFHGSYVREESDAEYIDVQAAGGTALPLGSACGTPVVSEGCATLTFPQGFTFPFGGVERTQVLVHTNGFLSFDTPGPDAPSTHGVGNLRFPAAEAPFVHLAPFWDGLGWDPSRYPIGNVHYLFREDEQGEGASLVIQWKDVGFASSSFRTASLNFEVVLWSDGGFDFRYGDMNAGPAPDVFARGSSATIGFQLPDRSEFDNRNFNTVVPVRGAVERRTFTYRNTFELPANGSYEWHPYATQDTVSANLRVRRGDMFHSKSVSVTVHAKPDLTLRSEDFFGVEEDATIHWTTNFATSVEVLDSSGTQRCLATDQEEVNAGSCTFQETEEGIFPYRVRATGAQGVVVEKVIEIKVHEPFGIVSFEADRDLVERGETLTLTWETENAPNVELFRNGELIVPSAPSGPGTHSLNDITEDTTFRLRVTNGIGISIERSVFVEAWRVQFAVNPSTTSLRPGQTVSIDLESKGLDENPDGPIYGTFPMTEVLDGEGFVSVARPGLLPLTMASSTGSPSPTAGFANVNLPMGFSFPYFGERYTSLRVFVEGFVSFNTTFSSTSANRMLPDPASTYAGVHLAPFWDDFSMHTRGEVYAVQTDPDTFVIQWTHMSLATGSTSGTNEYDLNFQLVLFRDGSFEYRYGTMAPSPNGSTSCRPNDCTHEAMASSATIGYQSPGGATGYVVHFGGASSNIDNPTIPLENRTFRYEPRVGAATVEFSPTKNETYVFCTETGNHQICQNVDVLAEFGISSFDSEEESIGFGESTFLTWETFGGTELRILDPDGVPILQLAGEADFDRIDKGSLLVQPAQNTTYTLELGATGNAASATRSIEVVRVRMTASAPVSEAFPGTPIEISWTMRNSDPQATPIVITPLREVENAPFSEMDISGEPAEDLFVVLEASNTTSRLTEMPFAEDFEFEFMGEKKTSVKISTSGYLSFHENNTNTTSNTLLPNSGSTGIRAQIAPFWDTLYTRASGRVIAKRWDVDTYVIQWSKMSYSSGSSNTAEHDINFMVVLRRNGEFEFRYGTMKGLAEGTSSSCQPNPSNCDNEANGSSATIAYQNLQGTAGFTLHHATTTSQLRSYPGGLSGRTFRYTPTYGDGSVTVTPFETTIYEICAFDPANGDIFCAPPVPIEVRWGISEFEANPWAPVRGDDVTLSWNVVGLDSLTLYANGVEIDSWEHPNIPEIHSMPHKPTEATTYTLEGISIGRTVLVNRSVEIRGFSLAVQQPGARIFPGDKVTIDWNATVHEPGDLLLGSPMGELPAAPGEPGAFVDRSGDGATKLTFSNLDSGSAVVTLPFNFPYFGQSYGTARVYIDGFISFEATSVSGNGTNAALPYTSTTYRLHLAPFWDNLRILDEQVDAVWTWTAPDQKSFVIQWKNFNRSGATAAEPGDLNFQVILYDDGSFEYRYGEMKAPPVRNTSCYSEDCVPEANGSSATIGYQTPALNYAQQIHFGGNSASAAVDLPGGLEHRAFRFDPKLAGSASIAVPGTKDVTICGWLGGFTDCEVITLRPVADPGDLTITEVMIDPTGGANQQWFEVRNLTKATVDLEGFTISGGEGSFTIAQPLPVAPGAFATFAASSTVPFTPELIYSGIELEVGGDTLALGAGTATISSLTWTEDWLIPAGRSLSLDPSYHALGNATNDDESRWCDDAGSPKAHGEGCRSPFYDVDPTSDRPFIDISATGTRVFALETASSIARIDAPGFSMPFFDDVVSRVWVAQNGWISFSSDDPGGGSTSNPTATSLPRTAASPVGPLVAAFWGTLRCDNSQYECGFYWEQRDVGGESVLILQWTGFRWSTANGSLTLQAQLWESGDVIIAFGDVYSNDAPGSTNWNNYRGNTAWIALEGPVRSDYLTGHHRSVLDMDHRTFHFIRK